MKLLTELEIYIVPEYQFKDSQMPLNEVNTAKNPL